MSNNNQEDNQIEREKEGEDSEKNNKKENEKIIKKENEKEEVDEVDFNIPLRTKEDYSLRIIPKQKE
jgi:hypothetical protein